MQIWGNLFAKICFLVAKSSSGLSYALLLKSKGHGAALNTFIHTGVTYHHGASAAYCN